MGVGYQASPLHRIRFLEHIEGAQADAPPPGASLLLKAIPGATWDGRAARFRSPRIDDIVRWRAALNEKYRSQLGEELSWDESSSFEQSGDVAASADMWLRYAAAVLDQQGPAAFNALGRQMKPASPVLDAAFAEASRRGFSGRFPQLLLRAKYWLPYERDLIMEEPNWRGEIERYGSLFRLSDEIAEIRTSLTAAGAATTRSTTAGGAPDPDILAASWMVSETVARLCAAAVAQRLPLWTTG
jgi:hypothetical protein